MMMKITKILPLMTILVIVATMVAACGPSATEAPAKAPPTEAPAAPTAAPTEAPSAEYDLEGREVRIGVENAYPPFNYIDKATNEAMGWDYDACRAICEVLNCTPTFVEAAWEGIFEATAAGEYDMVADGVTITSERDEVVDFSSPYMVIQQFIVVKADETEIVDEASLIASGAPVGTQIGTTNEAKAIELVGEERVHSFDTFDMPIQALIAGDVDAVIMDEEAAKGFAEQNAGDIKLLEEAVTGAEELGFVFPPGSDLAEPVSYAIGVLEDNGTLAELYDKYWGEEEAPAAEGYDLGGLEVAIGVENAYPPFNYIDEATNEPMGWDYDACRAICEVLNCTPVFVEAAWEGIFEATAAGEYDMVADGVTITPERDEVVDFSIPYMVIQQFIVVRSDETEIVDEASLVASGAPVGTQIGTTNESKAIELVGEALVQSFDTFDMPIQALIAGDVDAVIMDEEAAKGFAEQNAGEIKLLEEAVTGAEELGFVFPPGSELADPVSYAIGALEADGTLDELYDKYWGEEAGYDLGGLEVAIGVENAYPPFNYIDEATNEPMGWDYDACRAICEVLNCTPVFVEAAWEGIFEATAAGEYDMVADGVTITPERDEVVDFSIPYMVIQQFIVVRADETEIADEASLVASGAPVGTQIGTTNESKAIELVGEALVQSFDTFDMPIQALIAGDVDAVIMDEEAAKGFAEQNAGDIKLLEEAVTGAEELGFVFPPGSELTAAVSYAIGVLETDGTLAELYDKYWGEE